MPKVKIPRKSTTVDMTAMCDVAFLLLSFFILATKQKPPEVLAVKTPNSVSAKVAPENAYVITMTQDGRTFLMLGEKARKADILADINTNKALGLTPAELKTWERREFIGLPLGAIKSSLAGPEPDATKEPGIPTDTTNNEMIDWVRAIADVYAQAHIDQKDLEKVLLVKGDDDVKYPVFRSIKDAFKKNEIYKFRLVTNGEAPPAGSEMAKAGTDETNK